MGELVNLRKTKICGDCINGALSAFGVYCMEFQELITNETVANDCPLYEDETCRNQNI